MKQSVEISNVFSNTMPLYTIITVTYNAEDKLVKTLESVYKQTCTDYEYILIDGCSNDNTICIISEHQEIFCKKNIEYKYVTETDLGVYDAMNKGIALAKGQWIYFLNAGDVLYSDDTLEVIKRAINENDNADIIYGDTIEFKHNGLCRNKKALALNEIVNDMPFCHQSCVTKKNLLIETPFELEYKICSDYDFFMNCFQNGNCFQYIETPLSRYEFGGLSSCEKHEIQLLRERLEIQKKHKMIAKKDFLRKINEIERYRKRKALISYIRHFIPRTLLERRTYMHDLKNGWVQDN